MNLNGPLAFRFYSHSTLTSVLKKSTWLCKMLKYVVSVEGSGHCHLKDNATSFSQLCLSSENFFCTQWTRKAKFSPECLNVTNWGLSHKISGWGCSVAFVFEGLTVTAESWEWGVGGLGWWEGETEWETERSRGVSGLCTKPWQRQTGCTILWGRFNYKWCFHSEPSWNPLFFRRSSSPNPQQGLVWPASEVICLTHIVCHALWMIRRRHSCPNFAESSVNINTGADRMLILAIKSCRIESGFRRTPACEWLFGILMSNQGISRWLPHLCCPSLSLLLPPGSLPRTFFPFISVHRLSPLPGKSTGGGAQH